MKVIFIGLISIYQKTLFLRNALYASVGISPSACRFEPSCSVYTQQAIKKYGTMPGLLKGLRRLSQCHNFTLST